MGASWGDVGASWRGLGTSWGGLGGYVGASRFSKKFKTDFMTILGLAGAHTHTCIRIPSPVRDFHESL